MQTAYRDIALFPVEKIDYPYDTSTVFSVPSPTVDDEKIRELLVVDYRYARFALDPRTGLFAMIRLVSLYLPLRDRELTSCWKSLERFILERGGCNTGRVDFGRESTEKRVVWPKRP